MKGDLRGVGRFGEATRKVGQSMQGTIIAPGPEEMGCSMRMGCEENRITATGKICGWGHSQPLPEIWC